MQKKYNHYKKEKEKKTKQRNWSITSLKQKGNKTE